MGRIGGRQAFFGHWVGTVIQKSQLFMKRRALKAESSSKNGVKIRIKLNSENKQ